MSKKKKPAAQATRESLSAHADGMTLCSGTVGALPLVNQILDRIQLESFFEKHLPVDGPRMEIPTRRGLRLLIQNILLSLEPIYGLGEWAQRHAPDLTGIQTSNLPQPAAIRPTIRRTWKPGS
ncbi:hypothetical protein OAS39_06840 [Pirellulales bacterium]|nr:hypothetical protein [Pirellulales bacterium]